MANRDDLSTSRSTSGTPSSWATEEQYWRTNWNSRPYASADRGFDYYQPGYRYGYEAANRYRGRDWNDVESDLRSGWDRSEHGAKNTWESMKEAVRDAWNRVVHHH